MDSDANSQVLYAGKELISSEDCFWMVRAWDRAGKVGAWSPVAHWQMGLLEPADWTAKWIAPQDHKMSPLPYLRKEFNLKSAPRRAILFATALGLYEIHINGQKVGDHVLAPDWTDYRQRVRYQAYDVTTLLKTGSNAVGALLANGWFSGHIGNGGFEYFGKSPAFLAQLEITYVDGQTETVVTDDTWKSHASPILCSDLMLGEDYDSRREISGWDQPNLDENDYGSRSASRTNLPGSWTLKSWSLSERSAN